MKWIWMFGLSLALHATECWVEVVYWKPSQGGIDYMGRKSTGDTLVSGSFSGSFEARRICPYYSFGLRAGAQGCWGSLMRIDGTYIHDDPRASTRGILYPLLTYNISSLDFLEIVGSAAGSFSLSYWDLNAQMGAPFYECGYITVRGWGGVTYVNLDQTLRVVTQGLFDSGFTPRAQVSVFQSHQQDLRAVGPSFAVEAFCRVCCDWQLRGEVGGVALIGTPKGHVRSKLFNIPQLSQPNVNENQLFRRDPVSGVMPGLRFLLAVEGQWRCLHVGVRYSLVHLWNVVRTAGIVGFRTGLSLQTVSQDFGLAGPGIVLGVVY